MKFAVVRLPNEKGCEFILKEGEVAPPIFFFNPPKQLAVLGALLLGACALVGTTYFVASDSGTVPVPTVLAHAAPNPRPSPRTTVQIFDGSRRLKAGDQVIVGGTSSSQVRQVVAAPNEAVLLRSGNSVRALYMAGENRYVVVSGTDSRIVGADQIHAVVSPAPASRQ